MFTKDTCSRLLIVTLNRYPLSTSWSTSQSILSQHSIDTWSRAGRWIVDWVLIECWYTCRLSIKGTDWHSTMDTFTTHNHILLYLVTVHVIAQQWLHCCKGCFNFVEVSRYCPPYWKLFSCILKSQKKYMKSSLYLGQVALKFCLSIPSLLFE